MRRYVFFIVVCLLAMLGSTVITSAQNDSAFTIEVVASGLNSPRGVAFTDDSMLVIEAGSGFSEQAVPGGDGRLLELRDINSNGSYDDAGERQVIIDDQPSYNSHVLLRTFNDETYGLGDVVVLPDGRVFFTKDNPYFEAGPEGTEAFYGDTGIFEVDMVTDTATRFIQRASTVNGMVYDAEREQFYAVESGRNQVIIVPIDWEEDPDSPAIGDPPVLAPMPILANNQQPVPAGIALDPTTGDVLVALFSGFLLDYYGQRMTYMPGDARVMRVNVDTGEVSEEISNLTTAVDVAVDDAGNLFVVEMTTDWPLAPMPLTYDLSDDDAGMDPGGYARYTGRVTMYPADGSEPIIIMENVDAPSNITYHENALYLSTGLGTTGRTVWTRYGERTIEGIIYRITGF
ncbi:MAG: SMP-30/gluconolactonase/LRE family protein [Chloroflexota bacterium]